VFPQQVVLDGDGIWRPTSDYVADVGGMTLRQWYAGQALAGLCSDIHGLSADMQRAGVRCTLDEKVSDLAVMMADAVLKRLES